MATVIVAADVNHLIDDASNAWATRHPVIISELAQRHSVWIFAMHPRGDEPPLLPALRDIPCEDFLIPHRDTSSVSSRISLVARRLAHSPYEEWESRMAAAAAAILPDAVLTIGPWLDFEYRALFGSARSVHLLEEDITPRRRGGRSASPLEKGLRYVADAAKRRAGMTPDVVLVIIEDEIASAQRRFPRSQVQWLPLTLDPQHWPLADSPSHGDRIVVVGNLTEERNAEGLREVLQELSRRKLPGDPQVALFSARGLHPMLAELAQRPWVHAMPPTDDVYGELRRSRLSIVPSKHTTGFKTTILEAWTAGCPVVCFPSSAVTLGAGSESALVIGETAAEIVEGVRCVLNDESHRIRLAQRGLALVQDRFSSAQVQLQLESLLFPNGM